jgi:uncharacterized repeat protein (TIGR01451 family)
MINADQLDTDADGTGDACDETPIPGAPSGGEGDGAPVDEGTTGNDSLTDDDTVAEPSTSKPSVPEVAPAGGNHGFKVTICHANNGNGYVLQTVDNDSIVRDSGHDSHGRDIIPSFKYKNDGKWRTYDGKNTDKLHYIDNGCMEPNTPALLPSITVKQAQCVDGTIGKPSITIGDYSGVKVTAPQSYKAGDTVYITAELEEGYSWPADMSGWTLKDNHRATYRVQLDKAPKCYASLPTISVDQAACVDGSATEPLITLGTSKGLNVTMEPKAYEAGDTVVIYATIQHGYQLPDTLPKGWRFEDEFTAFYKIKLNDVHCKPKISISKSADVQTVAPSGTVTFTITVNNTGNGTASGVVVTDTLQSGFSGWSVAEGCAISGATISCDLGSIAPGGSASVTASATVADTAQCDMSLKNYAKVTWSRGARSLEATGQGGGHHGGEAWSNKVWVKVECEDAQLPEVALTDAVCTGGEVTDSSFNLTLGEGFRLVSIDPQGTQDGSTYSYNGNEDHEITIVIELATGYTMPDDLGDWIQDGNILSLTFTLVGDPCIEAMLATPEVTGNVCEAGVYTPPTVTTGLSEGISYSGGEVDLETGDYTVTATLEDGYAWPELLPDGWVRVDATTATYSDTLTLNECEIIQPVSPEITMSVCVAGEVTEPSLTVPADTDVINYELREGDPVITDEGYSYLVTATIVVDGYAFPEEGLLEGWTYVSPTVVQFSITLPLDECEIVEPVAPTVAQAVCTGGVLEAPEVILSTEPEGISYEIDGSVVPGATVTVIATITEDGLAWPDTLPEGWVEVDAVTATYEIVLDDVECEQVMLAAPDVTQAVCTGGELIDPTVTPVEREGIEYSFDETDVVSGGTVVITATIVDDGLSWADPIGEGWVFVSDTEATYTVVLDNVQCLAIVPVIPEATASECVGGVLTFPSVTAPQTEGIVYTWNPDDVVFGGTVIVTATLLPGYSWPANADETGMFTRSIEVAQLASVSPGGQMVGVAQVAPWPAEWVIVNETTATYTLQLVEQTCEDIVLPNLAIANAVCLAGTPGDPTLSVGPTTGVAYSFDANDVVNGGSVLVTATLTDGYKWGTLSNGWSAIDPETAALSVDFDNVECNRAAPSPNNPPVKALPNTGATGDTGMASGLWMLAATGAFGAAIAGLGLRKRIEQ